MASGPVVNQMRGDGIELFHGLSGEIPRGLGRVKIRSVVTIHDLIFVRYPQWYSYFDRKIYFSKFQYAARHSDRIIAITEQTKQDVVSFLKVNPDKIDVVYQGCNAVFQQPQSGDEMESVVAKLGLPKQFILNVGTIERRKNILTVVKAMKNIDFPLVIVGRKTPYFDEVKQFVEHNNISNRVYFLQGLELFELAALYKRASVFVYPSIFEGFGIPIIEALYSKTPVISSTGSCFSEAGGEHSLYADYDDVAAFQHHIENVLNDSDLQQKMSEKGWAYAQKFNDENVVNSVMNVYKKVMG